MSAATRQAPVPVATAAVLVMVGAVPLLASGRAATITENLYVADLDGGSVAVIEATWDGTKAATTTPVAEITDFDAPTDVAVAGEVALVLDGKFVWVVDTATHTRLGKVKTGKNTHFIAITPDGQYGLATQGKKKLKVIDIARRKVVSKVKTGKDPGRVRIDHEGRFGAVVNTGANTITVFELPVVLRRARSGRRVLSGAADGVRTHDDRLCELSGGLDVAIFPTFGTWAIWSCGGPPDAGTGMPATAAQQANISDATARTLTYAIEGRTTSNSVMWNGDCDTTFLENGVSGHEDLPARLGNRAEMQQAFNYNWNVERTDVLGDGWMANPFSLVDGNQLTLFHPKGVDKGKTAVVPDVVDGEISAVASTLTGVPVVCDR